MRIENRVKRNFQKMREEKGKGEQSTSNNNLGGPQACDSGPHIMGLVGPIHTTFSPPLTHAFIIINSLYFFTSQIP